MVDEGFDPHLAAGDVTVTDRDVAALRAIDRQGSMAGAADALGRSYGHLQRRIVELEDAVGELTTRTRGGSGGGGTELTDRARTVIRQFDRLGAELSAATSVTESVLRGTVKDRSGELATVETAAGTVTARAPPDAERVEVLVRSDAVVLLAPEGADATTSLRNRLAGTVASVESGDEIARVAVSVGDGAELTAVITAESRDRMGIEAGRDVVAAFKTTAARAVPIEDGR
jgi:molybdate transport system regulatory protein